MLWLARNASTAATLSSRRKIEGVVAGRLVPPLSAQSKVPLPALAPVAASPRIPPTAATSFRSALYVITLPPRELRRPRVADNGARERSPSFFSFGGGLVFSNANRFCVFRFGFARE